VTSSLHIDAEVLNGVAASFSTQANAMPMQTALDLEGCGSSTVAAAAESFNMWARASAQIVQSRLLTASTDASNAAGTFGQTDDDLAGSI